ncbi:MAG: hypothetical protein ACREA0_16545, partial [bacterium]
MTELRAGHLPGSADTVEELDETLEALRKDLWGVSRAIRGKAGRWVLSGRPAPQIRTLPGVSGSLISFSPARLTGEQRASGKRR